MGTGAARLGAGAGAFRSLSNSTGFNNVWFIGWKGHAHDRKRGEDERSKAEKVLPSSPPTTTLTAFAFPTLQGVSAFGLRAAVLPSAVHVQRESQ